MARQIEYATGEGARWGWRVTIEGQEPMWFAKWEDMNQYVAELIVEGDVSFLKQPDDNGKFPALRIAWAQMDVEAAVD